MFGSVLLSLKLMVMCVSVSGWYSGMRLVVCFVFWIVVMCVMLSMLFFFVLLLWISVNVVGSIWIVLCVIVMCCVFCLLLMLIMWVWLVVLKWVSFDMFFFGGMECVCMCVDFVL